MSAFATIARLKHFSVPMILAIALAIVPAGRWLHGASAQSGDRCALTGLETETASAGKTHYYAGETVTVSGSGYASDCEIAIDVTLPDGVAGGDTVLTDADGNFSYEYVLGDVAGRYVVALHGQDDVQLGGAAFYAGAQVTSDKGDYKPGETVTITGKTWEPGETVSMVLQAADGVVEDQTLSSVAGVDGEFTNIDFTPDERHDGVLMTLRATGESGSTAEVQFTDGHNFVKTIGTFDQSVNPNTSISVTVPAAGVAAGNSIIVAVHTGSHILTPPAGPPRCSDSKLNTYNVDVEVGAAGNNPVLFVCSSHNVTALVGGDTITANYFGFSGPSVIAADEFTGLAANPVDKTADTAGALPTGNSATPSTDLTATTSQNDELLFGAIGWGSTPTFTPGALYTETSEVHESATAGSRNVATEYRLVSATDEYIADGTLSASQFWRAAIVTYKLAPHSICGNGVVEGDEDCDDGNTANGDCCSDTCETDADDTVCTSDGLACNGEEQCLAGVCTAGAGDDPCTDDGLTCTTTCNEPNATCNTIDAGNCLIGGVCYADGDDNPANECQECVAGTSQTAFTNKADATTCTIANDAFCNGPAQCQAGVCTEGAGTDPCTDDGLACTTTCDETTEACNTINAGNCLIDNVCYDAGDENPANECEQCKPATSQTEFSDGPNGTGCTNDGLGCNGAELCEFGVCVPGAGPDPCTDDGLTCTTTCDEPSDTCNTINGGTCLISGFCYADGDDNPANECEECVAGTSQTAFTDKALGAACTADTNPCTDDACNGEGECIHPNDDDNECSDENECTENEECDAGHCAGSKVDCDDGASCTTDSCDEETGCANTPNHTSCNDQNFCTDDTCDPVNENADETTGCVHEVDEGECSSAVTNSSLCPFDIDPEHAPDSQFRLIFTPDQAVQTVWKLNASNPGQFYYNAFYVGNGNEPFTITLPYPFVTKGANPIHVYSGFTTQNGCFVPGTEVAHNSTQVTLATYGAGSTTPVTFTLPSVNGFAYINIHLDYGLKKGATQYSKNNSSDAIKPTTQAILLANSKNYTFSDSEGGSDTAQSKNVFKNDPGFAGLVTSSVDSTPIPNVKVEVRDSANKLLKTVYTDADGWYMWQWKYTGKAQTFTVKLPDYNKSQSVTMKSKAFVVVNFTVP